MTLTRDHYFMDKALNQAKISLNQGGIPIGSVLVIDDQIIGEGHNQRVQNGNPILHGEMSALQNAGRLTAKEYQRATIYTTLSPCAMCSGTIILYQIPRVVMAENTTFQGKEDWLRKNNITVVNLDLDEAKQMMQTFIQQNPHLWNEDIGI